MLTKYRTSMCMKHLKVVPAKKIVTVIINHILIYYSSDEINVLTNTTIRIWSGLVF